MNTKSPGILALACALSFSIAIPFDMSRNLKPLANAPVKSPASFQR